MHQYPSRKRRLAIFQVNDVIVSASRNLFTIAGAIPGFGIAYAFKYLLPVPCINCCLALRVSNQGVDGPVVVDAIAIWREGIGDGNFLIYSDIDRIA